MIAVECFQPEDLAEMTVQAVQREVGADPLARGRLFAALGTAFTARPLPGGAPIFCGGVTLAHPDYATMWSAFSEDAGPAMLAITRRTRWFIAKLAHRRIDTMVRSDHRAGHRWVHALGFVAEGRMNDVFEDGGDGVIYRLRRG